MRNPQAVDETNHRDRLHSSDSTIRPSPDDDVPSHFPKVDLERAAALRPSKLHGKPLMIMVNVVVGIAFVTFGYDQGVLSALLTLPTFIEVFPQTADGFQGREAATLQSFLVSSCEWIPDPHTRISP